MCQYSAPLDGIARQWHQVHIGSFATGGAGLIMERTCAKCDCFWQDG